MEKVTLIITVKNEVNTLRALLKSIESQSRLPDEAVIVDGGSTDGTYELLQQWKPRFPTKILQKSGNRSIGRNAAIQVASHEIIAITDAGCILNTQWLSEICKPFRKNFDVVAGYYTAQAQTPFEKAAATYMLVMPEHIDETNFLPATRSMALTKSIWNEAGKFEEQFTYNEDYVFAHALNKINAKMTFTRKAIVYWQPPSNLWSFLKQVYKFAFGDAYAGLYRPKVILIFARYIIVLIVLLYSPIFATVIFMVYSVWSIQKNYRHVQTLEALYLLPLLQISTDVTVMIGTVLGISRKVVHAAKD